MITVQSVKEHLATRFRQTDPWHFETSSYEKDRFTAMLDLIKSVPHASILEVGCAEGHFTQLLTPLAKDVVGLDIIPVALKRAESRAPNARYLLSSIEDFIPDKKYDVVNCSETIYYCPDKKKALAQIKKSGKYLVASSNILSGWRPNTADRHFWQFPLLKMRIVISWKEKKVCLISLRKLSFS
jgi:2-polyprenyl-3-methyl-5-hydroxy-6-metoxy-1,4-benzoquinol methylase